MTRVEERLNLPRHGVVLLPKALRPERVAVHDGDVLGLESSLLSQRVLP